MTAMDRAGMAIAVAITAIAVAFASYGGSIQSEGPSGITTTPQITPQQKMMEEEKAVESQKTMEEAMKEQREEMMPVKEPEPEAIEVTIPEVEEVPAMAEGPKTVSVSVPSGTAVPGCEETDACYVPSSVDVNEGDTVSWSNDDSAAHTVTSGVPAEGPDGNFDSSLFLAGTTYESTFDTAGEYKYFCMVHPWMVGTVNVS